MNRSIRVMTCVALMSLAGIGCGDDDDDKKSSSSSSSGVSEDKKLNALTDADSTKLCEWVKGKNDDAVGTERQNCTVEAVDYAEDKAECEQYVQDCIDSGDYADDDTDDDTDCKDFDVEEELGSDCSATVGELQDCLNGIIAQEKKALTSASCSAPDADLYSDVPASCRTLDTKCPGFFASDDGDDVNFDDDN